MRVRVVAQLFYKQGFIFGVAGGHSIDDADDMQTFRNNSADQ